VFEVEELAPGIVSYKNVMDNPSLFITDIESLVEIGQLSWAYGRVGVPKDKFDGEQETSKSIRDCFTISLPKFDTVTADDLTAAGTPPSYAAVSTHTFLNDALYGAINDYRGRFNAHVWSTSEGWQILKYGKDGHFINHFDDAPAFPRTVSMSFYLNEDYEGGEIEFNKFGLKIKPQANQMIVFPSNYVYTHTVHPVVSGTRYAIVGWWDK